MKFLTQLKYPGIFLMMFMILPTSFAKEIENNTNC